MRHVGTIASRELKSLFVSPVAYVVLSLWSVLGAFFFLSSLAELQNVMLQMQQFQLFDRLRELNLNDSLIAPFLGTMWIILIFAIPAVTMGLFTAEKANRTEELLFTSPVTIWEIVLGKYLAAAVFMVLLVALVAFFPGLLFVYGDPEIGKTASALLGLLLVSLSYAAIGAFASSLTNNQIIAFFTALVILLVLLMLSVVADLGVAQGAFGGSAWLADLLRYLSTSEHLQQLIEGLVDTANLAYFVIITIAFLMLTKAAVESARWR